MKTFLKLIAIACCIFGAIVFCANAGLTQVSCGNLAHWSRTNPPVNQAHIQFN